MCWQITGGGLEEERGMDQGDLDTSLKQLVAEVAFSSPTLVCVAESRCPVLYRSLGSVVTLSMV